MELVVTSHKPCWKDPTSPSGYATDGGFPFQMQALSELFDRTTLVVPVHRSPAPSGTTSLVGHNLTVMPLDQPRGVDWRRKLYLLVWLPFNLPRIWKVVGQGDAVHAVIGGDVGTIGLFVALIQRRPLFVRYCGIWGQHNTIFQHFWHWLLVRIAGGHNVVLATGGGNTHPSTKNPAIKWIFATTMGRAEIESVTPRRPWQAGYPLRLITVGRQEAAKNTEHVIRALVLVRRHYPQTSLDIVGDGSCLPVLRRLTADLDLDDAVTFCGKVDHDGVLAALNQADLFCFPTNSEGFPKAVHEALACGLPVITTPVSVLPQLIGNRNGVLINDPGPETIAQAILTVISDEWRLAAMSANARQTSLEYTLEKWRDTIGERLRFSWGSLREE